jgi:hypothetical protein
MLDHLVQLGPKLAKGLVLASTSIPGLICTPVRLEADLHGRLVPYSILITIIRDIAKPTGDIRGWTRG